METKQSTDINDLTITYGVTIASIVTAFSLGAYALAMAIAIFTKNSLGLFSIFSPVGDASSIGVFTTSAIALAASIVSYLGMKKINSSKQAGELVSSNGYKMINNVSMAVCCLTAGLAAIGVVSIIIGGLITMNRYTDWVSYLAGGCVPLVFLGCGAAGAAIAIKKFTKGELKPTVLSYVAMGIAASGLVLVFVALIVSTHASSSYNYFDHGFDILY